MTDPRRGLGQRGEKLASTELLRRGYTICEHNWRCLAGEVDIIAMHKGWLVFVEVRTRRGRRLGSPEGSITPKKRARMIRVAQSYLQETQAGDINWRIDIVAVEMSSQGKLLRVEVYENAVTG